MPDIRFVHAQLSARDIADLAIVAYYQDNKFGSSDRANDIDKHFRDLAEKLGYRVEKTPAEVLEAAE
jgi:hypothetical protein